MKLRLTDLREGANTFRLDISAALLESWLQDVDDLYHAGDAPASVELTLDRRDRTLLLGGALRGETRFACARCLKEVERPLDVALTGRLLPRESLRSRPVREDEELELSADDMDVTFYDPTEIDLEELVREAVLLELNPNPVCDIEACPGVEALLSASEPGEAPPADARWDALGALRGTLKN